MKTIFFALMWSFGVWAKPFNTDYIEFQLPTGWQCSLEGTEWVCQGGNKERKREAIIIMAAKERDAQDNIEQYQAYLQGKKQYTLPNRKVQVSEPKYTKQTKVNDHFWVDSLHLASEVPGFYTRYMATTKGDLGIAVTFSVAKEHYDSYQKVFEQVIKSMRVFAITRGKRAQTLGIKKRQQDLLSGAGLLESGLLDVPKVVDQGRQEQEEGGDFLFYLLLAAGVAGFIIYKKRQGKG